MGPELMDGRVIKIDNWVNYFIGGVLVKGSVNLKMDLC